MVPNKTKTNICPECQSKLFFSGNGRSLVCERCGYSESIEKPLPSVKELTYAQSLRDQYDHLNDEDGNVNARIRLADGRELLRNGNKTDAYDAFAFVLKTKSSDVERAEAWHGLSQIFEEPEEKRSCLEHAIALNSSMGAARRDLAILDGHISADEVVDPDQIHENRKVVTETAVAKKHACPRCDGGMLYSAEQEAYHCQFCGFSQTVVEQEAAGENGGFGVGKFEQNFMTALATAKGHLSPINLRVLQCQSCTTEFMLSPETLSVTCPYCESVFVTEAAESNEIMPPHALLPFSIAQDRAETILRAWLKKERVSPTQIAPLVGIYQPLWTFDIGGEVKWRGVIERNDVRVPVSGNKLIFFDDVLVPGSRHVSKQLLRNFQMFDLSEIEAYDPRFLANWPAERYTIPLADASLNGRKRVLKSLRKRPQQLTNRSEHVSQLQVNMQKVVIESFKLLLLPVWVGHYVANDTEFEVTINGQNGRIMAERPFHLIKKVMSWFK